MDVEQAHSRQKWINPNDQYPLHWYRHRIQLKTQVAGIVKTERLNIFLEENGKKLTILTATAITTGPQQKS